MFSFLEVRNLAFPGVRFLIFDLKTIAFFNIPGVEY